MTNQVYIHCTKGSGGSLLDVKIKGYLVTDNTISIHEITTNQKFKDDIERQIFDVGGNYTFAQIADFFLSERDFATGTVTVGEAAAVALSGYVLPPLMAVYGNSVLIADGDSSPSTTDHTDFGDVAANSDTLVRTFTITNSGSGVLNLDGSPAVAVSGTNAAEFVVTLAPQIKLAPGASTTFKVTFTPTDTGARVAALSISNSDSTQDPYNFSITGNGI